MIYLKLLFSFSYIGVFTFGGGYSMLPMFQRVLVEKNKWLTEEELTDLFSISQCLPGIIAANTAVFVGYKQKGILGGIVSALGVALPSLIIILAIAASLSFFTDNPIVQKAFAGLRVCVSVLIINVVIKLRKHSIIDLASALIFVAIFLLSIFKLIPIPFLVVLAGLSGIIISMLRKKPQQADTPPPDSSTPPEDNTSPPDGGDK